jgi:hypothetical protein
VPLRNQIEHLIRASADIAADDDIVVIGSQAILAQFPEALDWAAHCSETLAFEIHCG